MSTRHPNEMPSDPGHDPVEITVLSGQPTAQELAAVTAVLTALAEETAADRVAQRAPERSAWNGAPLRGGLRPGREGWIDAARR